MEGTTPLAPKDKSPADGRNPWVQTGNIMAGRDVNFGLMPEQVRELTEAAARGATEPLTSTIVDLSERLGITKDATRTLLRIVGEQDVPLERLAAHALAAGNTHRPFQHCGHERGIHEQSGREFASADPTVGAQDATLQERGLCAKIPLHPRRRLQHFQRPMPSHVSSITPRAGFNASHFPRRGDEHVARGSHRCLKFQELQARRALSSAT